jgi:NADP-dependent 3-hydroxy acid dehydrogenase YdfG
MAELTADSPSVHTVEPSLEGRNVIVTGGTTGIGRVIAALLAAEGANVLIFGRHERELRSALQELRAAKGTVNGLVADVARREDVRRLFEMADRELRSLDVLINNAGVDAGSVVDGDEEAWRYAIETDLLGYLDCTRHAVERMKRTGGGHIVNIGSVAAIHHSTGASLYVAAKAAIQGYSQALRKELGPHNIKVSVIEPGMVGTEILEGEDANPNVQRKEQHRGAMLKPQDIAVSVHYCLTQPPRCCISLLRIEPLLQD